MKFIKNNLRIIIAVVIALVLIIAGVIIMNIAPDNEKPNTNEEESSREERLEEVTGMSKDDAIEIVREYFRSDNYEFEVEVTNDSLYKITATNTITEEKIIYYVDPTNGMAYIDIDTN